MPAIKTGLYDATHNLTTVVAVNPATNQSSTVVLPAITSFVAGSAVTTNVPFSLTWSAVSASSTNLQYSCNENITLYAIGLPGQGDATTTLPCNTPVFSTPLGMSGTTTLMATNRSFVPQTLTLIMLPQGNNGVYLMSGAKTLNLPIQFAVSSAQQIVAPLPVSTTKTTPNKGMSHLPFFKNLARGSKGSDVVALQLFLALNTAIYPEGSATGFYGPATQRAVQRFQEKYNIAKAGEQGYGSVGPKTRAKLNALMLP